MLNCKPASTPVDTKAKLSAAEGVPLKDKTFYRSIVGALQYLTLTRPELAYAVQQACRTCMIHETTIGTSSNTFSDTFAGNQAMVFFCKHLPRCPSRHILMLTGRDARIRVDQHQGFASSSVVLSCPDHQSAKPSSPDPLPKRSTVVSRMPPLSAAG